jgi:predicted Zn-dependent protease
VRKETQLHPQHWPAFILMGSMEARQGDTDAAIRSLRQAMKSIPAKYRWLGHAELGRANLVAGNLDAAISELEIAARSAVSNPQVHFFLSQAYRRAGRKEDAQREAAEFEKLKVRQDPLGMPGQRSLSFGAGK